MPHHALNYSSVDSKALPRFPKTRRRQSSICQRSWWTCGPMLTSFARGIDPHNAVCSWKASPKRVCDAGILIKSAFGGDHEG
jgi:hypothetical protein